MVADDLNKSEIKARDVKLLNKIGASSSRYNVYYPKVFNEDRSWHNYSNPEFQNVESLYATGRGYFASLQDFSNAAERLKDYVGEATMVAHDRAEFIKVVLRVKDLVESEKFDDEFQNKRDADEIRDLVNQIINEADKKTLHSFKDRLIKIRSLLGDIQKE